MNLEDVRREYRSAGLAESDLHADPLVQFEAWLEAAVSLQLGADPTAMILATAGADGRPSQRTVLLKHFDARGLVFYTNLGSRKAREIAANAQVSLLFPWSAIDRQVIFSGRAEQLSVVESTRYFMTRPYLSQLGAWASRQSQPVSSRALLEEAFAQVKARYSRGEVPLPSFWGGYRIVPEAIEFWQGRENRLHDRFLYSRNHSGWRVERLQP